LTYKNHINTSLKLGIYILHSQLGYKSFESRRIERFSEDVNDFHGRRNQEYFEKTNIELFPNNVTVNFNMLGSLVENLSGGNLYGRLIVTIQSCRGDKRYM